MIKIRIEEEMNQRARLVQRRLGDLGKKTPNVLRNAINQTARRCRKTVYKRVKAEFDPSKKDMLKGMNSVMTVHNAKPSDMTAKLISKGAMNELYEFQVSQRTVTNEMNPRPKFYSANVLKSSGLKSLDGDPKPFIIRFKSGHVTMAVRDPRRRMKNGHEDFVKKLLSPAVPHMVQNKRVDAEGLAREMVDKELNDLIATQVDKILGGKK